MNNEIEEPKNEIFYICENIESFFAHIEHKLKVLKSEQVVLQKNNTASLHSFCLDSLNFQMRMFKTYTENYSKIYKTLNNQIYRDYYKLYKLMSKYIVEHINDKKIIMLIENDTYPIYKDLEVYTEYDFNILKQLYDNIINIVNGLVEFCKNKNNFLNEQKSLILKGYDIENLMKSHIFSKEVIESHIKLYKEYLTLFKQNKEKYLNELYTKVYNLYYEMPPVNGNNVINENIKNNNHTDQNEENDDNKNKILPDLPSRPPTPTKKTENYEETQNVLIHNNSLIDLTLNSVKEEEEDDDYQEQISLNNSETYIESTNIQHHDSINEEEEENIINTIEENNVIINEVQPIVEEQQPKKRGRKPKVKK